MKHGQRPGPHQRVVIVDHYESYAVPHTYQSPNMRHHFNDNVMLGVSLQTRRIEQVRTHVSGSSGSCPPIKALTVLCPNDCSAPRQCDPPYPSSHLTSPPYDDSEAQTSVTCNQAVN